MLSRFSKGAMPDDFQGCAGAATQGRSSYWALRPSTGNFIIDRWSPLIFDLTHWYCMQEAAGFAQLLLLSQLPKSAPAPVLSASTLKMHDAARNETDG